MTASTHPVSELNSPLRGTALARLAWLVLALIALGTFVAALPVFYQQLLALSDPNIGDPAVVRANLRQAGLTPEFYAVSNLSVALGFAFVHTLVALIIFARRSNDPIALLLSLMLIVLGVNFGNAPQALAQSGTLGWGLYALLNLLSFALFMLAFYLFPDGRFVPRWSRWLAVAWIALNAPRLILPSELTAQTILDAPFYALLTFVLPLLSVMAIQVYRYRYVSSPLERQQTKWVLFGVLIALSFFIIGGLASEFFALDAQRGTLPEFVFQTLFYIAMTLIPLSIAMAILRAHLWDIDILIRRTLIYGALTTLLTLLYLSAVVALQQFFRGMTGQESDLAIIVSTLAIAALSSPLRQRIQNAIDSRFYRRKYDAQQVLARFAATARNEVELEKLTGELLNVVRETMQPTNVSLWLRKPDERRRV